MSELFDKLIIRAFFTIMICLVLVGYRYIHGFLYPALKSRDGVSSKFSPSENSAQTLHLFSRVMGLGIIFSEFNLQISNGIGFGLADFSIKVILVLVVYLVSVYILESITLYNFEYQEEILKKKSMAYAVVDFAQCISISFILKDILSIVGNSALMFVLLWLFYVVVSGFMMKTFGVISKIKFNKMLPRKDMAVALSYLGFMFGNTIIIRTSLLHEIYDIKSYLMGVGLKLLLSLIILPIFILGIRFAYRLHDDDNNSSNDDEKREETPYELGHGIFEGIYFFTAALLTTVITSNIEFGKFYPTF